MVFTPEKNREANIILNLLVSRKTENVPLFYKEYNRHFSASSVRKIQVINNADGTPQIVIVNRNEAIAFLKSTYGFLSRSELRLEVDKKRRAKTKYNPTTGTHEPIKEE